jgi:hypothetical protein
MCHEIATVAHRKRGAGKCLLADCIFEQFEGLSEAAVLSFAVCGQW